VYSIKVSIYFSYTVAHFRSYQRTSFAFWICFWCEL